MNLWTKTLTVFGRLTGYFHSEKEFFCKHFDELHKGEVNVDDEYFQHHLTR
jgi:hypothetical protein